MVDDLVLVIGGTRSTGMHAAHALLREGIRVRVLARDPAAALEHLGPHAEIVRGDLTRKDTLDRVFAGVRHVIFTAGVRSGRFARQRVVRATEYEGVLNTLEAARAQNFRGRFVYMTSIGVTRKSVFVFALNLWKGNTIVWRRRAEEAIRASGVDHTIVKVAFLLNRPPKTRAIRVGQTESLLTLHECIARADAAEALVAAVYHPDASRATFEVKWDRGPRQPLSWPELLNGLTPDGRGSPTGVAMEVTRSSDRLARTGFGDEWVVRDARAEFFRLSGLPTDGGSAARFIHFRIGMVSFALPNTAARKKAVPLHDLHHLATGYDTSWTGEAEIAAWELGGGCRSYRAAWLLNLLSLPLGLVIAPVRTWRAFQRGRSSANLYSNQWDEQWLDGTLGQLRARVMPDTAGRPLRWDDVLVFLAYALPGLIGLLALTTGVVTVARWLG